MKLELWEGKVKDGNLSMFEHLGEALDKSQNTGKQDVMQLVQSHLASLRMELQSYFPELSELESKLIRNPFIVNVHLLPDNMQEEFLELVNDSVAKDAFETLSLTKFWAKMILGSLRERQGDLTTVSAPLWCTSDRNRD
ncbi:protein FAM200B-like [Portunus trituberculatus]|uniref:protein FAM200B-like n=1 Tax=Portunus trituberculatus TaxID=210409 RepID=UPI001E1CEFEA|nr:protein FAM200B-like [Portunus trituberculatus]